MGFYIRKSIGPGAIRFNVGERHLEELTRHGESVFSTGAAGEYRSARGGGLYFSEERPEGAPSPNVKTLKRPKTPAEIGRYTIMGLGVLLVLLGIVLMGQKGPSWPSYLEVLLGLAMILAPPLLVAKKNRERRAAEEKVRLEREEIERKQQEMVAALSASLDRLRNGTDQALLDQIRRQRHEGDLPYEAVAPIGRAAIARVGFDALSRFQALGASGVTREVDAALHAIDLQPEDSDRARKAVYQKVLWHLLADDRLSPDREKTVSDLRSALSLADDQVPGDIKAIETFRQLRGVTREGLKKIDVPMALDFQEKCFHATAGSILKSKVERIKLPDGRRQEEQRWVEAAPCQIYVTSKRIHVEGKGGMDVAYSELSDVEYDDDRNLISIATHERRTEIHLRVPEPILTGAMIGIASSSGEKRPGFFNA